MLSRPLVTTLGLALGWVGLSAGFAAEKGTPAVFGDFETEAETARFPGPVTRVREHATRGDWSLKFECPGNEKDTWPGVSYEPADGDWSAYDLLAFDVYNPDPAPVTLSIRVDDQDDHQHFASQSVKPQAVTTFEVWLSGLQGELNVARLRRIYPYISKPRRAYVLYLDNFRLARAVDRFRRAEYVDDAELPPLPDPEVERGFVLFGRHYLDLVFPNSIPRLPELAPKLQTFATPGEFEPITFCLRALRDLKSVAVQCGDLRSADGAVLPASALRVGIVRPLLKRLTYASDTVLLVPKFIEEYQPESLAANATVQFWLTLQVPAEAKEGLYRGQVSVTPEGGTAATLPVVVRVLPFRLPPPEGKLFGVYYRTTSTTREDLRRDLADMRDHGMTSVGLCFGPDLERTTIQGSRVELGWSGTSKFEVFMDLYKELGFEAPVILLADSAQGFAAARHPLASQEFADTYKLVQMALNREARRRGWAELVVQPVDEPAWQDQDSRDLNVRCLRLLKEIAGQRTEQDGPGDDYFHRVAGPWADFWNYNGAYAAPDVLREAESGGHALLIYNNDVEGYRPEVGRYAAGFHVAAAGTDGVFNWEYRGGAGDLYNDLDGANGDWVMSYLPQGAHRGGPAIGWEGFREGVDDQRYISLLASLLLRARASTNRHAVRRAASAEKGLRAVLDSLHYSPQLRETARFGQETTTADGVTQFRGALKVPNGWDFSRYDRARWQVAEGIISLLRGLDELPELKPPFFPSLPTGKLTAEGAQIERARPAPPVPGRPILFIHPVAEPPTMDGRLDEGAWRRLPDIPKLQLASGQGLPAASAQAWLAYDEHDLYLAVRCEEPQIGKLVANVKQDSPNVWQDDCVEVFLGPRAERPGYLHVAVNSAGAKMVQWYDETAPAPAIRAAASVGQKQWSVEIALPRRELRGLGSGAGFNLCRERRAGGELELSCWSPTLGGFQRPERFGELILGGKYLVRLELPRLVVGPNPATVVLRNDGAEPTRLALEIKTRTGLAAAPRIRLGPGEERAVGTVVDLGVGGAPEPVTLSLVGELGLPVSRQSLMLTAAPAVTVEVTPSISYDTDELLLMTTRLDLSDQVRRRCVLDLGWKRGNEFRVLQQVKQPPAGTISALVRAETLSPGEYTLAARLVEYPAGSLQLLGHADILRIAGPYGPVSP